MYGRKFCFDWKKKSTFNVEGDLQVLLLLPLVRGFFTPFFELFTEGDLQVLLLLLLLLLLTLFLVHLFLPPILPSCQVQGSVLIVVQGSFRSLKTIL